MNKNITLSLLTLFFVSLTGCINGQNKIDMFEEQLEKLKPTSSYQGVQNSANSYLKEWLSAGLEEVQILNECNWKVDDAVFFNTKKDKAYLLLLLQDKAKDAKLDYVYVMYGAFVNHKWNIYFLSLPSMVFPRAQITKDDRIPVSLEELSKLSRETILKGYYRGNVINDEYVERTYTQDLIRGQEIFLNQMHE